MSNATTDQNQSATAAAKDAEQQQPKAETVLADDGSKTEKGTDSATEQEQDRQQQQQQQQQQTGPGPKVLRSHYRGMPKQWEKNLHPKKEGE